MFDVNCLYQSLGLQFSSTPGDHLRVPGLITYKSLWRRGVPPSSAADEEVGSHTQGGKANPVLWISVMSTVSLCLPGLLLL